MVVKKIIIAANSDLNFDQRLYRIACSLTEAGFEIEIVGRKFRNSIRLTPEIFKQKRVSLLFQKGKLAYIELNIRFFLVLIFQKCDAVCSVDLDTLPACWLMKKFRNIKLIHDAHEYMEEVPEVFNRPLTKRIWNLIARKMLPSVDLAYTVSQSLVDEFDRIYKIKFGLVRNISNLQSSTKVSDNHNIERGYWVFLGAVNKGRGLEQFLEVLPATNRKLIVLGDGDVMPDVKRIVKDKQLENQVVFCGKVEPALARMFLKNAWAGINLLTDEGLSYRYSLANKFFDYVHAGIPQICIAFPEYKKLNVEHEVALLTNLEYNALLASTEIISMPEKQAFFRENANAAKLEWNWESESAKLVAMYQDLFWRPS